MIYRRLARSEDIDDKMREQPSHKGIWQFGPDNMALVHMVAGVTV